MKREAWKLYVGDERIGEVLWDGASVQMKPMARADVWVRIGESLRFEVIPAGPLAEEGSVWEKTDWGKARHRDWLMRRLSNMGVTVIR